MQCVADPADEGLDQTRGRTAASELSYVVQDERHLPVSASFQRLAEQSAHPFGVRALHLVRARATRERRRLRET
jgi:hypothetical protein